MERFADLLSQLAAEHERLRRECDDLRADAEAFRAERPSCHKAVAPTGDLVFGGAGPSPAVESPVVVGGAVAEVLSGSTPGLQAVGASPQRFAATEEEELGHDADDAEGSRGVDADLVPDLQLSEGSQATLARQSMGEGHAACSWKLDESAVGQHWKYTLSKVSKASGELSHADEHPTAAWTPAPSRSATQGQKSCPRGASFQSMALDCKMWPLWAAKDGVEQVASAAKLLAGKRSGHAIKVLRGGSRKFHHTTKSDSCLQALVMAPGSRRRVTWDVLNAMVLTYDVLSVPVVAFVLDDDDLSETGDLLHLATTSFWTVDIVFSFFSGFHSDGTLEMRPGKIASKYLRGWFLLDFPVVALDWCASVLLSDHMSELFSVLRINKVMRVVRVMRVFRLLRMAKLPGWADKVVDNLRSDTLIAAVGILRSLLIVSVASHYIACLWYFIGGHERPFTWIQDLDDEGRDLPYRYATALHWSVTQFTPASMEVSPRNTLERAFSVVVILSAMVAFSCFISSITQAMAGLQRLHAERDRQGSNMRRFFAENRISLKLGSQISRFARTQNVLARRRVQEKEVQTFQLLPDSIRQELHWEVYAQVLSLHPLFEGTLHLEDGFVQEVCHMAMSEALFARYEELFHQGQLASVVSFTRSGVWEYRRNTQDLDPVEIFGEKCLCEVSLWLQWELLGEMSAATFCEAACLSVYKFHEIVARRPKLLLALSEYATIYKASLESAGESSLAEVGFLPDVLRTLKQHHGTEMSHNMSRIFSATRKEPASSEYARGREAFVIN